MDLHKHVMLPRIFHGHVQDLDDLAPPERRDGFHGYTRARDARPVLDSVRQTAHECAEMTPTRLAVPSTAISAISP